MIGRRGKRGIYPTSRGTRTQDAREAGAGPARNRQFAQVIDVIAARETEGNAEGTPDTAVIALDFRGHQLERTAVGQPFGALFGPDFFVRARPGAAHSPRGTP